MELNKIYCMDCLEGMKQMEDNSVDLILTDPPYNASISKIKGFGFEAINEEWDKNFNPLDFLKESERVLKQNGSMIIFCSYHLLKTYLNYEGMKLQQIIHWYKRNSMPSLAKVYGFNIEYMLWFTRPNYIFNKKFSGKNIIISNVLQGRERTIHPTQKPLSIIRKLLKVHSNENDLILDPFMGSGTTAVACKQLNRNFIGFELSQKYCDIANERLNQNNLKEWFKT